METKAFRTLMYCQILEEHNVLTEEDFKVICEEIKRAGMEYKYIMPKVIPTIGFIDVYYKKPHEFVDANGIKFCIGPYKRTMDPKKISNKIGTFTISKDYRRETEDPNSNLPWLTHYTVDLRLYGYAWPYGYKQSICGHNPAGIGMIYEYGPDMESFRQDVRKQLETIKNYIDNGKPVIK